jgi:hypothetical protein
MFSFFKATSFADERKLPLPFFGKVMFSFFYASFGDEKKLILPFFSKVMFSFFKTVSLPMKESFLCLSLA